MRQAKAEEKMDKVQDDESEKSNNDEGEDAGTGRRRGSGRACQLDKFIGGVGDKMRKRRRRRPLLKGSHHAPRPSVAR